MYKILNLGHCLQTRCDSLSGGERKRTSIGQELVSRPDLLVLDEPTSGLDYYTSKRLILFLKRLAKISPGIEFNEDDHQQNQQKHQRQMAIVLTIHQPSVDIFSLFDRVYIMSSSAGKVIYDGPPREALASIEEQLTSQTNPQLVHKLYGVMATGNKNIAATLLLELASNVYGEQPVQVLSQCQRLQHLARLTKKSICSTELELVTSDQSSSKNLALSYGSIGSSNKNSYQLTDLSFKTDLNSHLWMRAGMLMKRDVLALMRDPLQLTYSVIFYAVSALLASFVNGTESGQYTICPVIIGDFSINGLIDNMRGDMNTTKHSMIQERQSQFNFAGENVRTLIILCLGFSYCSIGVSVLSVSTKIKRSIREVRNGWYGPSLEVFIPIVLIAIVRDAILPGLCYMLTYVLTNQPSSYLGWRMLSMSLITGLMSFLSGVLATICAVLMLDSQGAALCLAFMFFCPNMMLSRFTPRISYIRSWLHSFTWASYFHFGLCLLLLLRYGFDACQCDANLELYMNVAERRFVDLPKMMVNVFDYYITSQATYNSTIAEHQSSPLIQNGSKLGFFEEILSGMDYLYNFGAGINNCEQYQSFALTYFEIPQYYAVYYIFGLFAYAAILLLILVALIKYQIKRRV